MRAVRPSSARIFFAALVGVGALTSAPAHAETPKEVEELKARGFRSFKEGNYAAGIADMEAAYRLAPHPEFLFNVAVAYDLWGGHCDASLESFRLFFRACGECAARSVAEARFAATERRCFEDLGARAVDVTITTVPPDAKVQLAGAPVILPSPAKLRLRAGRHRLWVSTEGRTEESIISVGTAPLRIELALTAPRPRPRLVLTNLPPGDVRVDGQLLEQTTPIAVLPGRHVVELRRDATVLRVEELELADGQTVDVDFGHPALARSDQVAAIPGVAPEAIVGAPTNLVLPAERPLPTLVWLGAGTAVAGLVLGAVFGVETLGDLDREEAAQNEPLVSARVVRDAQDDATRHAVLAQVGVGVALTGAAVAILAWALDDDSPDVPARR
jgi:hypothetical protein